MSAFGGKADVRELPAICLLIAKRRHRSLFGSNRNVAHRDAGGGSRPQHHKRTLALPQEVERWSPAMLREKLLKIGAKVVRHGRYVTFQLAEVAVPRDLFEIILRLIDDLRRRPAPA